MFYALIMSSKAPRSVRNGVGGPEHHRIVAHMISSDYIIFSNINDGLLDREGNCGNREEPFHFSLFVLTSCWRWAVLLLTAKAPEAGLTLRPSLRFLGI